MLIAGVNFVLLYRGFVRRRPRVFVRDEEFRLYIALVLAASIALTIQIWGYGIAGGEEAIRAGVFQTDLDHHDDRVRDRGLRAVARPLPADHLSR